MCGWLDLGGLCISSLLQKAKELGANAKFRKHKTDSISELASQVFEARGGWAEDQANCMPANDYGGSSAFREPL